MNALHCFNECPTLTQYIIESYCDKKDQYWACYTNKFFSGEINGMTFLYIYAMTELTILIQPSIRHIRKPKIMVENALTLLPEIQKLSKTLLTVGNVG